MFEKYNIHDELKIRLQQYIEHGKIDSSFLKFVLQNDLFNAVLEASPDDIKSLEDLVRCIYFEVPTKLWGSADRVHRHCTDYL